MALYICRNCGERNTEAGFCDMCGNSLGSLRIAMLAGFLSSLALGGLWVLTTWLVGVRFPTFGVVYGLLVSTAVTYYSAGRGIEYQATAILWTVVGVIVADTFNNIIIWKRLLQLWGVSPLPSSWELLQHPAQVDSIIYLSIVGGLWIWREQSARTS